ncbi:hypothetical protein B0T17DRAFT_126628 [Bombardia bombarda]|uniref:Uncharacterized protein n=1 Tax=Bombardia bombarda TaxID=252184 RepID=A0AA39U350_9PEZI|nr:hypothetical protein B0T17DRAFT_126628 [Bombardia bombarda]
MWIEGEIPSFRGAASKVLVLLSFFLNLQHKILPFVPFHPFPLPLHNFQLPITYMLCKVLPILCLVVLVPQRRKLPLFDSTDQHSRSSGVQEGTIAWTHKILTDPPRRDPGGPKYNLSFLVPVSLSGLWESSGK